jgi:hypothetical protein
MKKILTTGLVAAALLSSLCLAKPSAQNSKPNKQPETVPPPVVEPMKSAFKKCNEEKVKLPNYGDPGKRLSNCFVQYPGEPSRQDKSYYIVEDICGQFTKEFVENMLGLSLLKIAKPKVDSLYNCTYYFTDQPAGIGSYVMLNLEYLNVENQKKGHEMAGRTIKTDPRIPMKHFIVWQKDGLINEIYLVLGPEKFISINRSSGKVLDNEKDIEFAANLAKEIKNYK